MTAERNLHPREQALFELRRAVRPPFLGPSRLNADTILTTADLLGIDMTESTRRNLTRSGQGMRVKVDRSELIEASRSYMAARKLVRGALQAFEE